MVLGRHVITSIINPTVAFTYAQLIYSLFTHTQMYDTCNKITKKKNNIKS